jgi:transcription-repair coupling factor (superfamily II helicase)
LEFFGDEIDAIRTFDPATQRSTDRSEGFWITPVREALPRDSARALPVLNHWLALEDTSDGALPQEMRAPLEKEALALEAGVPFPNLEFYMPYLYQEIGTLLHYLPVHAPIVLYNGDVLPGQWQGLEAEAQEIYQQTVEAQPFFKHLPSDLDALPSPYVTWNQMKRFFPSLGSVSGRVLTFRTNPEDLSSEEPGPSRPSLADAFTPEPHFAGRIPEALGRIRQWVSLGDQVVVVSRQAARLAELWREFNPPPVLEELRDPPEELITFMQGAVPGGWQLEGASVGRPRPAGGGGRPRPAGGCTRHLITDEELFGWRPPEPRRRPRRRAAAPELPFASAAAGFRDLQPGDYVVHEDYGIGIFKGLVLRNVDNIEREYILLEYAGNDRLFVPIHQADCLSRYVGVEGLDPQVHRLDGARWAMTKARVQKATDELAEELLELYAAREMVQGHAFASDTAWQRELEVAFPYVETEDQLQAIQAVKADMEKAQPMDRLICGDSGYGKTEVALRAAFKCVMDGKQVAMLVPTTILAQQHYHSFCERLAPFPVNVELLSRFRTGAEQANVLSRMRDGGVDIVIGTHRLLQKDVQFKDLGLAIIDEEQRFGVAHKERLKQMRTEVDVLTLTATPIPRTLYMAMTGVRDISIIETPPQERLPISTYIGPYDPAVARRAILRELRRNGQVFYVHNRVETIRSVAKRLETLVPEAQIAVAHGQMREKRLASAMERFTTGEIDVLLATTIIESGLDFPNANTLIVERADRFGLAQLYQLRGRVGRGANRGYAYFFHARRLKEEARQRLQALQETTSAGGGFSVALRDLEIRGAGELLGRRQHGHIAAVGFTLYTRALNRAVKQLKAERRGEPAPPVPVGAITIELPLAVGLPKQYIPDDNLRLQLYRRLANLTHDAEIAQLENELRDRFGPLPQMAENLLYQLRLKVLARDAGIPTIAVESGQIVLKPSWLHYYAADAAQKPLDLPSSNERVAGRSLAALRQQLGERARVGRYEIWLPLLWEEAHWRENLRKVLEILAEWVSFA